MKITNNLCLLTHNGQSETLSAGPGLWEIVVPGGEETVLSALVFSGDLSVRVVLTEPGASCRLKCVYLAGGDLKSRIRFDVIHRSGETVSDQIVKGILTDQASVSFEGRIRIPRHSQKCEAAQNHRAVVLTDQASVTAVPELEIYADDVRCAHGSAIGALDQTQLFYLMARGVPEEVAKKVLLRAFVRDILDPSFETYVDEWMEEHV